MTVFFEREQDTKVRLATLEIFQKVLWSFRMMWANEIIELGLLPYVDGINNDRDPVVRRRGLEIISKIATQIQSSHLAKLAHKMDIISWEDTAEAREVGVATLIELFPVVVSRPSLEDTLAVFNSLIALLQHRDKAVRFDVVQCLKKLRATKSYCVMVKKKKPL